MFFLAFFHVLSEFSDHASISYCCMRDLAAVLIFFQVRFVNPLLRSLVVGDVAYETLVKLSRCIASPLCNWAIDIAAALRLIVTEDNDMLLNWIPSVDGGGANETPSLGLFERVINGLSISCKSGALPVDSFTFVFPVRIAYILISVRIICNVSI